MPKVGDKIYPPYWDSIKENIDDVVIESSNPFDSDLWIDTVKDYQRNINFKRFVKNIVPFKKNNISEHLLLMIPLIDAIVREKKICRIVDFGGGMGDNYSEIINYYGKKKIDKIEYNIIDTPNNCKMGEAMDKTKKINFISNNPDAHKGVEIGDVISELHPDIVIICSTLQCLYPYQELLLQFVKSHARYIYITRTPMTKSVPTFFCRQRICPAVGRNKGLYLGDIKVTIINEEELSNFMSNNNYVERIKLFHSSNEASFSNFPSPYNEIFYKNYVFECGEL